MRFVLIAVLLLVVIGLVAGRGLAVRFDRYARQLMNQLRDELTEASPGRVDPDQLPATIRAYAERAGANASPAAQTVLLSQSAELRMGPEKAWKPLRCEQLIAIRNPGFVWYAVRAAGPVTVIGIIDAYVAQHGRLQARLFGSLPVAKASGPELDRSELMRYLAEIAWVPDAVLYNGMLRWHPIDDRVVGLEADSNGGTARVSLHFDEHGDIVEVLADERGSMENGIVVRRPWRGIFSKHREMGGRRIPTHAEAGYVYDDGYAAYWRGDITDYRVVAHDS